MRLYNKHTNTKNNNTAPGLKSQPQNTAGHTASRAERCQTWPERAAFSLLSRASCHFQALFYGEMTIKEIFLNTEPTFTVSNIITFHILFFEIHSSRTSNDVAVMFLLADWMFALLVCTSISARAVHSTSQPPRCSLQEVATQHIPSQRENNIYHPPWQTSPLADIAPGRRRPRGEFIVTSSIHC